MVYFVVMRVCGERVQDGFSQYLTSLLDKRGGGRVVMGILNEMNGE